MGWQPAGLGWERGTLRETLTRNSKLNGHAARVQAVDVTRDGRTIVACYGDGALAVWKARALAIDLEWTVSGPFVCDVAIAANGCLIAAADSDNTVKLWGPDGGLRSCLVGHIDRVESVAVAEDGRMIVTGSRDGTVRLWDGCTGQLRQVLSSHRGGVREVAVTDDGRTIVSCGRPTADRVGSETIRVWNGSNGSLRHELKGLIFAFTHLVTTSRGTLLANSTLGLHVWNIETGVQQSVHPCVTRCFGVTPDGRTIVAADEWEDTLEVWDGWSDLPQHELRGHPSTGVLGGAVTPDGAMVVTDSGGGDRVLVWDTRTGTLNRELVGHTSTVTSVAVTADGTVVSGCIDGSIRVWNGWSGSLRQSLTGHRPSDLIDTHAATVSALTIASDAETIVSGGFDGYVRVWNGSTATLRYEFGLAAGNKISLVEAVAITADRRTIVSGHNDGTVRVWDGLNGHLRNVLTIKGGAEDGDVVEAVAVMPNGAIVVSSHRDHTVRIWDGHVGKLKHILTGHKHYVRTLAVVPDGDIVASGDSGGAVRVWDTRTGSLVARLPPLGVDLISLAIECSAGGIRLVVVGKGTTRFVRLTFVLRDS